MKRATIVFVDAMRVDQLSEEETPFLHRLTGGNHAQLRTLYGYSSGIHPSIWTGRAPAEHRNWTHYVRSRKPTTSWKSAFRLMPFGEHHIQYAVSKALRTAAIDSKFLPGIPSHLHDMFEWRDYDERGHASIFTLARQAGLSASHFKGGLASPVDRTSDIAVYYYAELDGVQHRTGVRSESTHRTLTELDEHVRDVVIARGAENVFLFSDHGMIDIKNRLDVQGHLRRHGLKNGRDFCGFFDSTMARFWFDSASQRLNVEGCLAQLPNLRLIPRAEADAEGIFFEDGLFGDAIYVTEPGIEIYPNYFHAIRPNWVQAMHGYAPGLSGSDGVIATSASTVKLGTPGILDILPTICNSLDIEYPLDLQGRSAAPTGKL